MLDLYQWHRKFHMKHGQSVNTSAMVNALSSVPQENSHIY